MKALPMVQINKKWIVCGPEQATHIKLELQGPLRHRFLPIQLKGSRSDTNNWSWNGSVDHPTIKPSVLSRSTRIKKGTDQVEEVVCHTFINDGMVQYLSDCTHELANQTLELMDVEE